MRGWITTLNALALGCGINTLWMALFGLPKPACGFLMASLVFELLALAFTARLVWKRRTRR